MYVSTEDSEEEGRGGRGWGGEEEEALEAQVRMVLVQRDHVGEEGLVTNCNRRWLVGCVVACVNTFCREHIL